jgi:hypothetical protein
MGGGPSALLLDLGTLLRGKTVLAINDAIFHLVHRLPPSAVGVFSADNCWVSAHRSFLRDYAGERHVALPAGAYPECRGIDGVNYLELGFEQGLSYDPKVVHSGGNSGYAALNLAVMRGALMVHLLGYDMNPLEDDKYRQWAPRFRTMLPQLERLGVTVTNWNPESHLDAFPRRAWAEAEASK